MNLLIFECFSGGGCANQNFSSSILSEAYGMLRSFISDCKVAGHNITTLMDSRLTVFDPPNEADTVIPVCSCNEAYDKLKELSGNVDAVYIIAPESGRVLEGLLESVGDSGVTSLNCEIGGIKRVSNKMSVYRSLMRSGLKVPETVFVDLHERIEYVRRLAGEMVYPLVFKPVDGVGCSGLSVVKDEKEVVGAVNKVGQESSSGQFVVQKQTEGKPVSVSVISTGDKAVGVTLNRQWVTLASPDGVSSYDGGEVPLNHPLETEALKVAERAVEATRGLRGYVGVDMILTDEEPVVIEINPRLTTSYIGLKRVADINIVDLIVDAVISRRLPVDFQTSGFSFFSKVLVPSEPRRLYETYKLGDVVSPPFPVEDKRVYGLVASASSSRSGAQSGFYRSKKRLLSVYGGD